MLRAISRLMVLGGCLMMSAGGCKSVFKHDPLVDHPTKKQVNATLSLVQQKHPLSAEEEAAARAELAQTPIAASIEVLKSFEVADQSIQQIFPGAMEYVEKLNTELSGSVPAESGDAVTQEQARQSRERHLSDQEINEMIKDLKAKGKIQNEKDEERYRELFQSIVSIPMIPAATSIPEETKLRERIEVLYKANAANDRDAFNKLILPGKRRKLFDGHLYELAQHEIPPCKRMVSWKVLQIEPQPVEEGGKEEFGKFDALVQVPMEVIIEMPDGTKKAVPEQTDYWVHVKGGWYWVWRGWPAD